MEPHTPASRWRWLAQAMENRLQEPPYYLISLKGPPPRFQSDESGRIGFIHDGGLGPGGIQ